MRTPSLQDPPLQEPTPQGWGTRPEEYQKAGHGGHRESDRNFERSCKPRLLEREAGLFCFWECAPFWYLTCKTPRRAAVRPR
jgi:hypothetical protein